MSTQNSIETEVKIAVPGWSDAIATERLAAVHFAVTVPRIFEANFVYDTPQQSVRGAEMLLRLRRAGENSVFTWKGPGVPGPHKSRPELEVRFDSFENFDQILKHLGYQVYFRYEKYRTEFGGAAEGTISFDETPIGNYLELEGPAAWIDVTAGRLGFCLHDYVLDSYGKLYQKHCAEQGVQPLNMLFPSSS